MSDVVKVIVREKPSEGERIIRYNGFRNRIFVDDRPFTVGQVFDSKTSQEQIYLSIQPLVKKFIAGYCCNIMSYGQSGTGKSFTMGFQCENLETANCGIVNRALKEITDAASKDESTIEISFLEIYNEKVFDLLSNKTDEHINTKGSKLIGGVKRPLKCLMDAELILMEANKNRRVRPTTMNSNSSRSHGIVVIYKQSQSSRSSLYLVDLAGSEGVRRTGHKGEALAEGSHINRGLLGIGNIFKALSDGSCRIPYRDTVLGSVLQDSLNINSFSTFVICISGLKRDASETINSLTFAQKVMNMKSDPKINQTILAENRKMQTPLQDPARSINQKSFETPFSAKRPLAFSSTTVGRSKKQRANHFLETSKRVVLNNFSNVQEMSNYFEDAVMMSPNFKKCFEELDKNLQKRNMRLKSVNCSPVFLSLDTTNSSGDGEELNSTVIQNIPLSPCKVPSVDSSFVTKEECIKLVESRIVAANFPKLTSFLNVNKTEHNQQKKQGVNKSIDCKDADVTLINSFQFKAPEISTATGNTAITSRRSIRIQINKENREKLKPEESIQTLPQQGKKVRKVVRPKKVPSVDEHIKIVTSKDAHRKQVLHLLNTGDMKSIQVLPQIGMKTAYGIITHRSLNGTYKNFNDVAKGPFWRGKGWQRFQELNNLI